MSVLKIVVGGLLVASALALSGASELDAHPFHTTTGEMEYNAQSKRFEVAVKVPAADLEEALTRQLLLEVKARSGTHSSEGISPSGRLERVALDKTADAERLIVAYLKTHFFLSLAGGPSGEAIHSDVAGAPSATAHDEKRTQAQEQQANSSNGRSTLHWLGMELDKSSAWLYFELEPPKSDKLSLVNDLFFELNARQINTCTLRMPATKVSLRTDANQPQVALPPLARSR